MLLDNQNILKRMLSKYFEIWTAWFTGVFFKSNVNWKEAAWCPQRPGTTLLTLITRPVTQLMTAADPRDNWAIHFRIPLNNFGEM